MFQQPTYNCFSILIVFAFAVFSVSLAAPFSAQTNTATLTVESSTGNEAGEDGPTRILFVLEWREENGPSHKVAL